jgi:hypothetical protein
MDPKIAFLYLFVLGKREPLCEAIGEETDDNCWLGVSVGSTHYHLRVKETNAFLKKYLNMEGEKNVE